MPVKGLERFYHFVQRVIHSFTGADKHRRILWKIGLKLKTLGRPVDSTAIHVTTI